MTDQYPQPLSRARPGQALAERPQPLVAKQGWAWLGPEEILADLGYAQYRWWRQQMSSWRCWMLETPWAAAAPWWRRQCYRLEP